MGMSKKAISVSAKAACHGKRRNDNTATRTVNKGFITNVTPKRRVLRQAASFARAASNSAGSQTGSANTAQHSHTGSQRRAKSDFSRGESQIDDIRPPVTGVLG